ncbi:MAG: protein kinase [Prosthecobacter sp.]
MASSSHSGSSSLNWVPPTAEELQQLLPQYEITAQLGRGGMGAVYRGRQITLDRPVAIKILSNALDEADASFAERFKNEARSMAKLAHPGIVGVYDFGETASGLLYIVMEFIEGTDVAKMIAEQGRLPVAHALAITAHVCDALQFAHDRSIIHRDIKPANIMVGYDGVVKVADFGLAKMNAGGEAAGLTQSGMALGTLHYMAPEALMLGSSADHRADIYAVGVMLYQMLTGKVPHGMFELPSKRVPDLDPRYDDIIARAMREDRDLRYQQIGELRRDLDTILTQPVVRVEEAAEKAPAALPTKARPQRPVGRPVTPPHSESSSEPSVGSKSSGSGMIWAVVGGVVVLGVLAVVLMGGSRKDDSGDKAVAGASQPPPAEPKPVTVPKPPAPKKADPVVASKSPTPSPVPPPPVKTPAPAMNSKPVASPSPAATPPSPVVELKPEDPLTVLAKLQGFQTRVANYQKARATQLGELTAKYRNALAAAKQSATQSGNLTHVVAMDQAIQRATTHANTLEKLPALLKVEPLPPLPALDDSTPDSLKKLRGIFDGETVRIEEELKVALGKSLNALQVSLVKSGDLDSARAIDAYRKQLDGAAVFAPTGPFTNSLGMKFVPVKIGSGPSAGTTLFFSVWETRVADYAAFAAENDVPGNWRDANNQGVEQTADHPAILITAELANKFCDWLSKKENMNCRLPTSEEWDWAAGIRWVGQSEQELTARRNERPWKGGQASKDVGNFGLGLVDDFPFTAPVGSYPPNQNGLFDIFGNVWEWVKTGENLHLCRGGGWGNNAWMTEGKEEPLPEFAGKATAMGFRVVVDPSAKQSAVIVAATTSSPMPAPAPAPSPAPASAADHSLINGRDLTGWQTANPAAWKVENDTLVCRGADSLLAHPLSSHNVDLLGEFRVSSKASGGMIFFATSSSPDEGWEVPIVGSGVSAPVLTGGIIDHKTGAKTPPGSTLAKDGEWQRFRLVGSKVQSTVFLANQSNNTHRMGRPITSPTHFILRASAADGEIAFRNLVVRDTLDYPGINLGDPGNGPEWTPLLNDSSLSQWKLRGNPKDFQLKGGTLQVAVTDKGPSYLFLTLGQGRPPPIKSFDLMFKARATGDANSGIYFHVDPSQWQSLGNPSTGYEVNLANEGKSENLTGAVFNIAPPLIDLPDQSDWFDVRLCVKDNRVLCLINGKIAQDFVEPADRSTLRTSASQKDRGFRKSGGAIAIQALSKNGSWFIKDMRFKNLD